MFVISSQPVLPHLYSQKRRMQYNIPSVLTDLAGFTTKEQTQALLRQIYPHLSQQFSNLSISVSVINEEQHGSLMATTLLKMNEELDALFQDEEEHLYPFLLQLEAEQRKSDSCKPFTTVKAHYLALLKASEQLKRNVLSAICVRESEALKEVWERLRVFIQDLIRVQIHKEKYVLQKFRNCNGNCKSLGND